MEHQLLPKCSLTSKRAFLKPVVETESAEEAEAEWCGQCLGLLLTVRADPSPPHCFSWDTLLVLPDAMIKLYESSKVSASSLMHSLCMHERKTCSLK